MQSQTYPMMKILSGPHKGAEVILAPGEHDVGSHEDCDVVMSDQTLAPRHARVVVDTSGLSIMALEGTVFVDGVPVDGEPTTLALFATVSLGTTELKVGLQGAHWGEMMPRPHDSAEAPGAAQEDKRTAPEHPPALSHVVSGVVSSVSRGSRDMVRRLGLVPPSWSGRTVYSWGGVGLVTLLVLFALPHLDGVTAGPRNAHAMTANVNASSESTTRDTLQGRLETEIARLQNPDDVAVAKTRAGTFEVTGYVANRDEAMTLDQALRPFGRAVRSRVWARDDLLAKANAILRELKLGDVKANDAGPGQIVVEGYVRSADLWQSAHATLLRDHPGIRDVDGSKVETLAERGSRLREWLSEDGLDLDVVEVEHRLQIAGRIEAHATPALESTIRRFREQYEARPPVTSVVETVVPRAAPSTLAITATVVSPGTRYLVTKNGDKYWENERLPDGYVVASIEPRRVLVRRNDRLYVRHLGARALPEQALPETEK